LSGKISAVVFNPGHSLIIKNNVTVNGALTFENNSLVQINDNAVNSGNIIYNWSLELMLKIIFTGLLPYEIQKLADFSTTKYLWNATVNNWVPTLDLMQIGQGYIIRQMEK
jgi:hypothetical protein